MAERVLTRDFCLSAVMLFDCLWKRLGRGGKGTVPPPCSPPALGDAVSASDRVSRVGSRSVSAPVRAPLRVAVSPSLCLPLAAGAEREGGVIGCRLHGAAPSAGTHTHSHTHIRAHTPQKLTRAAPAPVEAGSEHPAARRATPPPLAKKQPAQRGE